MNSEHLPNGKVQANTFLLCKLFDANPGFSDEAGLKFGYPTFSFRLKVSSYKYHKLTYYLKLGTKTWHFKLGT